MDLHVMGGGHYLRGLLNKGGIYSQKYGNWSLAIQNQSSYSYFRMWVCADNATPPSSGLDLAYFPLGLLLPCDAFLTASLPSYNHCRTSGCGQGSMGSGKAPEGWKYQSNTITLSMFPCGKLLVQNWTWFNFECKNFIFYFDTSVIVQIQSYHTELTFWQCKNFCSFYFCMVRHHVKCTKICTDLKFPTIIMVAILCLHSNHIKPTITMLILYMYIRHSLICSSDKIHSGTIFCHIISKNLCEKYLVPQNITASMLKTHKLNKIWR